MTKDAESLWRWISKDPISTRFFETMDEDAAVDLIETGMVIGVERRPSCLGLHIVKMKISAKGWDQIFGRVARPQ